MYCVFLNICTTTRIHLQVVKESYDEKGAEEGPKVIVTLVGDEVGVKVADEGISLPSGWSLEPLATPKVLHLSTWLL